MVYNILLVDDDTNQIKIIESIIKNNTQYHTQVVGSGEEAVDLLTSKRGKEIDLVLLDLSMPHMDGIAVLNAIKPLKPDLPIVVRTGYDDIDMAVKAMKAGATDFVKKLDEPERLKTSINNALRLHLLHEELGRLKKSIGRGFTFSDIIGCSKAREHMIELGKKVAASSVPVLLEGESGVGKELLARAIHTNSDRNEKPFMAVNCGAIPENLVESILFGHEKGSFTGAMYKTTGKFREAEGGTVFLDEVAELRPDIQVKLLRVLQDGEIEPIGANKTIKVNIRLISATNKNLVEEIKAGRFREDLYYRLNVFPIFIPGLKERRHDISLLIQYYCKRFSASEGKVIEGVTPEATELLMNYDWPGNIRELKNMLFRAIILTENTMLGVHDFPQLQEHMKKGEGQEMVKEMPSEVENNRLVSLLREDGNFKTFGHVEKEVIGAALEHYDYHMSRVARFLDMGRSTLYRKMKEHGFKTKFNK